MIIELGDDPRSARQSLTSANHGYWLIHNHGIRKAKYQLDDRHLSGDPELDKDARIQAEYQLKTKSKKQCVNEMNRFDRAAAEFDLAYTNFQLRFKFCEGNTNDSL